MQLTQGPVQLLLQQTPSAQCPEAHCPGIAQAAPFGLRPQLPATHLVLGAQSESESQVPTQVLVWPSQLNGAQMTDGPEVQLPAPSQTRMPLTAAPLQVPGWQTVPSSYVRQPPLPSQVPSSPQDEAGLWGQTLATLGGTPAATNEQTPGAEGVLQDLQLSLQALLQQTPSTQKSLVQSLLQPHAAPLVLRAPPSPQDLLSRPPSSLPPPPAPLLLWQPALASASASSAGRANFAGNPLTSGEDNPLTGYWGRP
jgi:hypothetical protein